MGAKIAAHLASAGMRVHLLDIVPKDVGADAPASARNAIAAGAIKAMLKDRQAPFMHKDFVERITLGNFDDDLESALGESDLMVEAVIERLDIKQGLFARAAKAGKPTTVLATNTSGIPIGAIASELPADAKKRVVGMHFFNPPRHMHLLEVVPSEFTDDAVVQELSDFSDRILGKGVVVCRDTPNFIGNRVGIAEMLLTFQATKEGGYTIEEVDFLNGPLMGRPKTGSYRLGDLVGLDVVGHVVRNLSENLSGDKGADNWDPLYDLMSVPEVLEKMFERKMLGNKTKGGFYKKTKGADGKKAILSLDLDTLEYREKKKARFDEFKTIRKTPQLSRRLEQALKAEGRGADFLRKVYLPLMNYAAWMTGNICDTPKEIDDAMKWGYGWKAGPFEIWDAVGLGWGIEQLEAMGHEVAPAAKELASTGGDAKWYGEDRKTIAIGKTRKPIVDPEGMIRLSDCPVVHKNTTAALLDLGDGVACVEFRSKMNSLDEGVVRMLTEAPELAQQKGFKALVVGSQEDNYCVGANLMQIVMFIMQKKWDDLEGAVKALQDSLMGLRHGPLPVVTAPYGMALGGGCELIMHGDEVQACADSYIGLVEIGVGVLPAGGGLKEICRRASAWASQLPTAEPYDWVRNGFESVAQGKVGMSAYEAQSAGWIDANAGITFHRSRVIADAKRRALALADSGYVPPDRNEAIDVIGAPRGSSLEMGVQLFGWGGYASEHDKLIGRKVVHVLSGGMGATAGKATAQDLLDLEREAFVSLCGEEKTAARMQYMLENNKPLRN